MRRRITIAAGPIIKARSSERLGVRAVLRVVWDGCLVKFVLLDEYFGEKAKYHRGNFGNPEYFNMEHNTDPGRKATFRKAMEAFNKRISDRLDLVEEVEAEMFSPKFLYLNDNRPD